MGKWEKLNKRLDDVLGSLTQEDWVKWDAERIAKNDHRKQELLKNSILHAYKIASHWRYEVCSTPIEEMDNKPSYTFACESMRQPPGDNISNNIKNDSIFTSHFFLV